MDLDIYYKEQDQRMNIPEEDIDEYLARAGLHRKNWTIHQGYSLTEHEISLAQRRSDVKFSTSVVEEAGGVNGSKKSTENEDKRQRGGIVEANLSSSGVGEAAEPSTSKPAE
ncbi:hypothetical protein DXG01_003561 [Tephrocybe rancida]|nr:hypothetical protein DXG01_003561 [Tephrocybe rancida]